MSRVLILGAAGLLGHKLCQRLAGHERVGVVRGPAADYARNAAVFSGVDLIGGVDVLEPGELERTVREVEPEVIVNCVGIVKQRSAAEDPVLSVAINSLLPHRLAALALEIGGRLIHISTDCVFDGRRGAYSEADLPDARDLYGRSKALGETLPQERAAVTLRTSFIGRELAAPTHGLLEWFLAQDGGSVDGYARVVYSGVTSLELVAVVRRVIERAAELRGVYQIAGAPITKLELLRRIRSEYGLDVEIRPVDQPVSDRSLVMDAFRGATGYRVPSWREMIQRLRADPTPYGGRRA